MEEKTKTNYTHYFATTLLYIVSGYSSPSFAAGHLDQLKEKGLKSLPQIRLIIGMFPDLGNLRNNHAAFQALAEEDYPLTFECRYVNSHPPVHTKAYAWYKKGEPFEGFLGSANYTKKGFSGIQQEAMIPCAPDAVYKYYQQLFPKSIDCRDDEANRLVQEALFKQEQQRVRDLQKLSAPAAAAGASTASGNIAPDMPALYAGLEHVTLNFLGTNGTLPQTSGLNWGQRPGRERDQAYIPVASPVAKSHFFPQRKEPFTVLTDDEKSLLCVIAQDGDKAIQTPANNSFLGLYFRNRLGMQSGAPVSKQDLLRYGRTTVDFYKVDDETYFMDFSVSP